MFKRVPYTERFGCVSDDSTEDSVELTAQQDRDLHHAIRQAGVRLNQEYGLGYRVKTYNGLLSAEFKAERITYQFRPQTNLTFGSKDLGKGVCDCFLVDGRCVVNLLALYDSIHPAHRATTQSYMRHLDAAFGCIINFGKRELQFQLVTP